MARDALFVVSKAAKRLAALPVKGYWAVLLLPRWITKPLKNWVGAHKYAFLRTASRLPTFRWQPWPGMAGVEAWRKPVWDLAESGQEDIFAPGRSLEQ